MKFLKFSILEIIVNRIIQLWTTLFQKRNVHKTSQLELWLDVFKNICKGVKSCITSNSSSNLPHKYLSWIVTGVFWTILFQSIFFQNTISKYFHFYFMVHTMKIQHSVKRACLVTSIAWKTINMPASS